MTGPAIGAVMPQPDGPADVEPAVRTCWEITLNVIKTDYTPLPDGGMILHLTPLVRGPGGQAVPMAPQVMVRFAGEGWERFKAEVASDGRRAPASQIATPTKQIIVPR